MFLHRTTSLGLIILWVVLCWTLCLPAQPAAELEWEHFGPEQGVGMSFLDIIQDRQGFIWLGSSNGLYRYDGYRIQSFKKYSNHPTGLSSDSIRDLEEDAEGNIWIATYDGGLSKWDRASGNFIHFMHDPKDPGSLRSNHVIKILIDPGGHVWAVVKLPNNVPVLDRLEISTGEVAHYSYDPDQPGSMSCDTISITSSQAMQLEPLYLDPDGRVWVATANGLNRYDPASDSFRRFVHERENPHSLSFRKVLTIEASPQERDVYWVRSASPDLKRVALDRLDSETGVVERIPPGDEGNGNYLGVYWPKQEETVWISDRILFQSQRAAPFVGRKRIELEDISAQPDLRVGIFGHSSGNLLLPLLGANPLQILRGSDERSVPNGIFYVDTENGQSVFLKQNPTNAALPFGDVLSIMEDRSGIIWIGLARGFYKLRISDRHQPARPVFENYFLSKDGGPGLLSTDIRSIYEESSTVFWLATHGGGLARLDRATGRILHFLHDSSNPNSLGSDSVYALWYDPKKKRLWIGHQQGVDILDLESVSLEHPATARFHHLAHSSGWLNDRINEIQPDGAGKLWIGTTHNGLLLFDPVTEEAASPIVFDKVNPDPAHSAFINKVFIDSTGQTWVAPGMGGLCRLTPADDGFQYECFLDGLFIVDFFEAGGGWLWCAAMNYGLVRFHPGNGDFELINMENRLVRNSVTGIEKDQLDRIWFTSVGLTRYDPVEDTYKTYGREAGVIGLDPERCFFKSRSGELFYSAAHSALQIFTPEKVIDNPHPPQVVLTDFRLFNQSVSVEPDGPLKQRIEVASEIRLAHDQHPFSLAFAGLEYTNPRNNQYRYRLRGVDSEWVYAGTNREARYNKLRPGQYVFEVAATNNDGVWSLAPATLQIFVAAPWWRRWWAYALFFVLFLTPVVLLYRYEVRRKVAVAEARRLQEIDELKNRLYTNITHEFRTPLTVILGMAEQVAQQPERWLKEGVKMIVRNGRHLLDLVNQMLDLRKIEAGAMNLDKQLGDVIPYLKYITESFHSYATSKSLDLSFSTPLEEYQMDYDSDSLLKILSNLLSNAVKFTPAGGSISVAVDQMKNKGGEMLEIRVADTGIGIPVDQQAYIFRQFYQVDDSPTRRGEGTGIGLTLTRELVRLLDGVIELQSEPSRGSEFRVLLPVTRSARPRKTVAKEAMNDVAPQLPVPSPDLPPGNEPPGGGDSEKPLALVIEDNRDVVNYLRSCLEANYNLITAYDGRAGIEKALERVPDIIVSDVMMPELDGFEVTDTLKNDERTSHIPIILLTARAAVEDRIAGLKRGADAYLAKPFDQVELQVTMNNLIELRNRLRERYAGFHPQPEAPEPDLQIEDDFVRKVREQIEARLGDPDFGVEALSGAIFLSPPQVHRKLKALTGLSTGLFIRTVRLQTALKLLQTTDKKIAEIAMDVGFKDPAYFTRVFTEMFGRTPSEMRSR